MAGIRLAKRNNCTQRKILAVDSLAASLILHFFNHQTHHQGQVSTLLSQAGEDIAVTSELLVRISEEMSE